MDPSQFAALVRTTGQSPDRRRVRPSRRAESSLRRVFVRRPPARHADRPGLLRSSSARP